MLMYVNEGATPKMFFHTVNVSYIKMNVQIVKCSSY